MKKSVKILLIVLACVLVIGGAIGGYFIYNNTYHPSKWLVEGDDAAVDIALADSIDQIDKMDNTWQEALPQTAVYDLIQAHFTSPLPEGKTAKKAIVIGYDGCRVDMFRYIDNAKRSAIGTLLGQGGHAIFTYAGGAPYDEEITQATSTAPGWCSMLTGVLSDVHGVTGNGQPKAVEPKTLLLSLPENGTVNKSAFYVSWDGHFSKKTATYINEKDYAKENGVNATFCRALSDTGTRRNVLADLQKADCSDFIFLTIEYTDHTGHGSGFGPQNPKYVSAFRDAEDAGLSFIEAIQNRATYDSEDWLILITTDHGGIGGSHGGPSFEERMTFIVSNKEILA